MRCEFQDGLKVDYAGSLHISKGKDVDLVLHEEEIPDNFKGQLQGAARRNSCSGLRDTALKVSDEVGSYIP